MKRIPISCKQVELILKNWVKESLNVEPVEIEYLVLNFQDGAELMVNVSYEEKE